ncbi:hypothetical protein GIB67_012669 [Kingdonia uniflora]|uniref:Uncharacterized protein n=1 Tax=Kingdonia uniflora TaxID=39325 RepID=A0A7J7NFK7_9MAGN|nr:hypothetical protein GIB67_012669 [Kingdonia uniflora]
MKNINRFGKIENLITQEQSNYRKKNSQTLGSLRTLSDLTWNNDLNSRKLTLA